MLVVVESGLVGVVLWPRVWPGGVVSFPSGGRAAVGCGRGGAVPTLAHAVVQGLR